MSIQNRPDGSGWKQRWLPSPCGVEMKGILEMPFKAVQFWRKWKAL